MRFTSSVNRFLPVATLALAGPFMAHAQTPMIRSEGAAIAVVNPANENKAIENQVSERLRRIQSHANKLNLEADNLQGYAHGSRLSWQTHAAKLNLVREQINAISQHLQYLQSIQTDSAPWQQRAIDRIVVSAAPVASRTQAAIGMLNDKSQHVSLPVYTEHLLAIYEETDRLKEVIDPFIEFDAAQRRLDEIRSSIGLDDVGA